MPTRDEPASAPTSPATVLFDIDGTLVDTNYFHAVAWFRAFRQVGQVVSMADIHRCIGMGSDMLLDALLPDRDRSADEEIQHGHTEHYSGFFGVLQPFRGAVDLLRDLAGRGATVVLATSASPVELQALRTALDVEDALATVTSSADAEAAKPEPDIIEAALAQSGADASRAVMVGDSVWDVKAAAKAGLPCIGVCSGGISEAELRDAGAVEVYHDVADLAGHLDDGVIAKLLAG